MKLKWQFAFKLGAAVLLFPAFWFTAALTSGWVADFFGTAIPPAFSPRTAWKHAVEAEDLLYVISERVTYFPSPGLLVLLDDSVCQRPESLVRLAHAAAISPGNVSFITFHEKCSLNDFKDLPSTNSI